MARDASIDLFRGISIILMVFFTLILGLSDSLPEPLVHNVQFSLHLGDFVLPMFLFASGMSIVHFRTKIAPLQPATRFLIVAQRISILAMIWFFLSPFTSGLFEMDELILSGILFVPAYLIAGLRDRGIVAAGGLCLAAYFALSAAGMLPDFASHYLGGFGAAPFYLPVMLAGILTARNQDRIGDLVIAGGSLACALTLVIPPYKMSATPSFMLASVFFSLVVFLFIRRIRSGTLEYLGRAPLRYWVLMIALIIVPLKLYVYFRRIYLPLGLDYAAAAAAAMAACVLLYCISKALDRLAEAMAGMIGRLRRRGS